MKAEDSAGRPLTRPANTNTGSHAFTALSASTTRAGKAGTVPADSTLFFRERDEKPLPRRLRLSAASAETLSKASLLLDTPRECNRQRGHPKRRCRISSLATLRQCRCTWCEPQMCRSRDAQLVGAATTGTENPRASHRGPLVVFTEVD